MAPAPDTLLDLISCNCKQGCENNCPCAAALLKCSSICGQCAGTSCSNAEVALNLEEEDEEVEDHDDPYENQDDPDDPESFTD